MNIYNPFLSLSIFQCWAHLAPAMGSPAGRWAVLPDDLLSIMRLPRGPRAVWHVLPMRAWDVQAVPHVFQVSPRCIRVCKVKAKTQVPVEEISCEICRPRSMQFLSVFSVSKKKKKKTRMKVLQSCRWYYFFVNCSLLKL